MGRRHLIPLVCCVVVLAGCGSASENKNKPSAVGHVFHRDRAAACLKAHGFTVSTSEHVMNFIAYTATGGGLRAWKPKVHRKADVILAFGADGADAQQTIRAIRRFAPRPSLFRYRLRDANVVILWAYRPSQRNKLLLKSCLDASVKKSA
jgi:hypothetical protein